MFRPECLVCNDYKKINSQTDAYELAHRGLSRITRKIDVPRKIKLNPKDQRKYLMGLNSDEPNGRLVCGNSCSKASISSSKRAFELTKDECQRIIYYLLNCTSEDEFKKVKREALLSLRVGYLPHFYRMIDSIKFKGDVR